MLGICMSDGTIETFKTEEKYLDRLKQEVKEIIYIGAIKAINPLEDSKDTIIQILSEMFDKKIETKIQNTFKDYAFVISKNSILYYINTVFSEIKKETIYIVESFNNMPETEYKYEEYEEQQEAFYMELKDEDIYVLYGQNGEKLLDVNTSGLDEMIIYIIKANPKHLIVYDYANLMLLETIVCLKSYLKDKVVFINDKYPIYKN